MHYSKAHIWFVGPAVILMIIILIFPIFLAGGISFTNYNLGNQSFEWIGLENYDKMFSRKIADQIDIMSKGFEGEIELSCKVAKMKNVKIIEVPISYNARTYDEGKKITWIDGVKAIYYLLKFRIF